MKREPSAQCILPRRGYGFQRRVGREAAYPGSESKPLPYPEGVRPPEPRVQPLSLPTSISCSGARTTEGGGLRSGNAFRIRRGRRSGSLSSPARGRAGRGSGRNRQKSITSEASSRLWHTCPHEWKAGNLRGSFRTTHRHSPSGFGQFKNRIASKGSLFQWTFGVFRSTPSLPSPAGAGEGSCPQP